MLDADGFDSVAEEGGSGGGNHGVGAGAGPPAKRIATFFTGWGISQGEAIVDVLVVIVFLPASMLGNAKVRPPETDRWAAKGHFIGLGTGGEESGRGGMGAFFAGGPGGAGRWGQASWPTPRIGCRESAGGEGAFDEGSVDPSFDEGRVAEDFLVKRHGRLDPLDA